MPCPFPHFVPPLAEREVGVGPAGGPSSPGERAPHAAPAVAERPLTYQRMAARTLRLKAWSAMAAGLVHGARRLDGIDRFALVLLTLGMAVLAAGTWLEPPSSVAEAVRTHYEDWAPGLLTDGLLLLVVNSILRRHERRRVLSQVGSLSREFALDAVRRAREEGWLKDGALTGFGLSRAELAEVDLSGASLARVDLSFSDLAGASLAYADLRGADLTGADLSGADLRWTDLSGATLRWADLRDALLEGARLEGADAGHASVDPRYGAIPAFAHAVVGGFLDAEQVAEVRRTFDLMAAQGSAPVERFYQQLFRALPEATELFSSSPTAQARKFLQSLKVIVSALDAPQRHVAVLERLGERHHGYGVRPEHYDVVGRVLVHVLAETLGEAFTDEARTAWRRAFDLMATVMVASGGRG